MRKATPQNQRFAGHAMRLVAAASLACSLAAFGCTTDRTPGSGEPQRFSPRPGPTAPTSSSTPGSEGSTINPPMTSSYTGAGAVLVHPVNTDALAIAVAHQEFRGRVLGPADPGGVSGSSAGIETGQFVSPTTSANPEITVNSSISSAPTPVISSGGVVSGDAIIVGGGGVVTTAPVATSATSAVTNGTVGNAGTSSVAGVTSATAPIIGSTTLVTPTTAGALSVGQFAAGPGVTTTAIQPTRTTNGAIIMNNNGGTLTPTVSSGATISPTIASNPAVSTARTATTTRRTTAAVTTSPVTTSRSVSSPLVIGRSANGTLIVTNVRTVGDRLVTTTPVNNNLNLQLKVNH